MTLYHKHKEDQCHVPHSISLEDCNCDWWRDWCDREFGDWGKSLAGNAEVLGLNPALVFGILLDRFSFTFLFMNAQLSDHDCKRWELFGERHWFNSVSWRDSGSFFTKLWTYTAATFTKWPCLPSGLVYQAVILTTWSYALTFVGDTFPNIIIRDRL